MKQYEFSGGRVRRSRSIYVERKADADIYTHLKNDFDLITITAPRQCGKTSMAYGIGELLSKEENRFIFVDFRSFSRLPREHSEGDEGTWWFHCIFKTISRHLKLKNSALNTWLESVSIQKMSLTNQFADFFKNFIRSNVEAPLVVVFDEIDRLGEWGYYTDDFFDALGIIFNERDQIQISFILAAIAHPTLLLKGVITSKFKTGLHYSLPDFDIKEDTIAQWAQGLRISDEKICFEVCKEILTQTGGQPYLTAYLMYQFNEADGQCVNDIKPIIDKMVENALMPNLGLPHFKAPRDFIVERERYAVAVLNEYRKILEKPVDVNTIDGKVYAVLNTTGLIKMLDNYFLDVRSPIYRRVFDKKWCENTELGLGKRDWYSPLVLPSYFKKKKATICLFNIGGRIGMREEGNKMVFPLDEKDFFSTYPSLRNIADIDYIQFAAKDGANTFPQDWGNIAKTIYRKRNDGYDGFVIAHGTDTMIYTASAAAFSLGPGLNKPVVFVGAQTSQYVPYGDALANLSRACEIASKEIPEVVICFGDEVYRAVRAEKYSDYHFKGFHSPTFPPLAVITEMIEIQKDKLWVDKTAKMECKAEFEDRVLQISQYPGFDPIWLDTLLDSKTIKGIIIESLGIGNLPTLSESKYNLLPVIEKAIKEYEIPVIITSKYPIKPEFRNKYIPATAPLQKGAISAGNMTTAAALTKLMWLLPQIEKDIINRDLKKQCKLKELKRLMEHSYVGEVDEIKVK
jgi:L-asparaginase